MFMEVSIYVSYISIHALLAESDVVAECGPAGGRTFLSTLSLRRATGFLRGLPKEHLFLSTLSLRRATAGEGPTVKGYRNFYPRSPCGERLNAHLYYHSRGLFLSTLSLRRATLKKLLLKRLFGYFYPRSPCGERPASDSLSDTSEVISIHALLAESDKIMFV